MDHSEINNSKEKNQNIKDKSPILKENKNISSTNKTNKHRSFSEVEFKKFELENNSNYQLVSTAIDRSKSKKNANIKIRSWCGKCFQYFENSPMSKICFSHASKETCNIYPCTKINDGFICIRMFPNQNSENRHTHCISKEIVDSWDERIMIQNYIKNKAKLKNERKNLYDDLIERNNKLLDKNSISLNKTIKTKLFIVSSVKTSIKIKQSNSDQKINKELNVISNQYENESKIFKLEENDFLNFDNKCKITEKGLSDNLNNISLNNHENLSYYFKCNFEDYLTKNDQIDNNNKNEINKIYFEKNSFEQSCKNLNICQNNNLNLFEKDSNNSKCGLGKWFNKNPSISKSVNQNFINSSNSNMIYNFSLDNNKNGNDTVFYYGSQLANSDFFKNSNLNSLIHAVDKFKMDKDIDEFVSVNIIPDMLSDIKIDCGTNINNSLITEKNKNDSNINDSKEFNKSNLFNRFKDLKLDDINSNLNENDNNNVKAEQNIELLNQKHNNMLNIFVKKESEERKIPFVINDSLYKFCNYNKIKNVDLEEKQKDCFELKSSIGNSISKNCLSLKEEIKDINNNDFLNTTKISKRFKNFDNNLKSNNITRLLGEKTKKSYLNKKELPESNNNNSSNENDKNEKINEKNNRKEKVYHSSSSSAHSSLIRNKLIFNNFHMVNNNINKNHNLEIVKSNEIEFKSNTLSINNNFMLKDDIKINNFILEEFNKQSNCNFSNFYLENVVKKFHDNGLFNIRSLRLYLLQFSSFDKLLIDDNKNIGFELHLNDLLYRKSII